MLRIAPSLLSADFAHMADEVRSVRDAGADWLHVDVMDGLFVPNISLGLPVLASLRRCTDIFLDVHLMIDRPARYAARFCDAGADLVTLHAEADSPQGVTAALAAIREKGKLSGLVLKPATPAEAVLPWLDSLDLVLVMTVEPGFGGQKFMPEQLPKLAALRQMIDQRHLDCLLEVDGGVTPENAAAVVQSGADVLVAGSAVFGAADRAAAIRALRQQ